MKILNGFFMSIVFEDRNMKNTGISVSWKNNDKNYLSKWNVWIWVLTDSSSSKIKDFNILQYVNGIDGNMLL